MPIGQHEQRQGRQQGDGVVARVRGAEQPAPAAQRLLAGDPRQGRKQEDHQHAAFLGPPRLLGRQLDAGRRPEPPREPQPNGGKEHKHHRHADPHPIQEREILARDLGIGGHEDHVRGRADRSAETADVGGIGQPEHHRRAERLSLARLVQRRQGDGEHHQHAGRVGDPHAHQRGGDHETQHQPPPAARAHRVDHPHGQPTVCSALFHRHREHEPADQHHTM